MTKRKLFELYKSNLKEKKRLYDYIDCLHSELLEYEIQTNNHTVCVFQDSGGSRLDVAKGRSISDGLDSTGGL